MKQILWHNGIKLEVTNKNVSENSPDIWKLHSMLPNKPCIKKEIKEEIRKYFEMNEN